MPALTWIQEVRPPKFTMDDCCPRMAAIWQGDLQIPGTIAELGINWNHIDFTRQ
jgi:hypothetical protein